MKVHLKLIVALVASPERTPRVRAPLAKP
jgi:hypothetical protein